MNILVCVKRVPATGAKIVLNDDAQSINTKNLGFVTSPHEECAIEEAVQLVAAHGGSSTVMTLGTSDAAEQLKYGLSMGCNEAVLLEVEDPDWDPQATAKALVAGIEAQPEPFDMLLFGNESADSGGYQVGIRVAQLLDIPCITGIKDLEIDGDKAIAKKETSTGWEVYEVDLPALFTVKEGINLPRYPSVRGRMKAKKANIPVIAPEHIAGNLKKLKLVVPEEAQTEVEILGEGVGAVPRIIELLEELRLIE